MMKVVVAVDSFKGSLSSSELADSIGRGVRRVYPEAVVEKIPVADGGEGTVEALVESSGGHYRSLTVKGPLWEPVVARYGISGDGTTAIIEMAAASGLPLVPVEKRNPELTTTYGTGELILDALGAGCRRFIIGIGGSATNDCGMGMMQALGMKFLDREGLELEGCGENLIRTETIDDASLAAGLMEAEFHIACDVENPLYGENGAAFVYSRQKGADDSMVIRLDEGLKHFSAIVGDKNGFPMNELPGAGAAGGLGGAFAAFLSGNLEPGIKLVLEGTGLGEKMSGADFVITGEGRIDYQTVMGKTPVGVARLASERGIPVIAIAGSVSDDGYVVHEHEIDSLFSVMNYPIALDDALVPERTAFFVEKNMEEVFRLVKVCERRRE